MSAHYREFTGLNLPALEKEVLSHWAQERTFEQSIAHRDGKPAFVFHEGPPSANGMPGIHHVISRTLKDLVCRYQTMKMNNIWEFRTHKAFSESERAALEFALASSTIPNSVDDRIAENLRFYWNEGEIVEIVGVVALFGYLNRWNDSMGTELEKEAIESGEKYLKQKNWTAGM
ncbi:MAG: class I tRNA ligase family protein [Bacteroidetes bacterium]|nr:class I tRNA ligase family protein [Bacteroidota bacterium]